MNKSLLLGALCAYLTIASLNANAAIITYDENIDGDLVGTPDIGIFDIGINTVSGITAAMPGIADFDGFLFTISSGQIISSLTIDYIVTTPDYVATNFRLDWEVSGGLFTTLANLGINTVTVSPGDMLALTGGSPLVAGNYRIYTTGFTRSSEGGTIDYTWSVGVAAVPIPAAAWLFGSGLLGLIGVTKRKAT